MFQLKDSHAEREKKKCISYSAFNDIQALSSLGEAHQVDEDNCFTQSPNANHIQKHT